MYLCATARGYARLKFRQGGGKQCRLCLGVKSWMPGVVGNLSQTTVAAAPSRCRFSCRYHVSARIRPGWGGQRQPSPPHPQLGTFSAQSSRKRVKNAKREHDAAGAAAQDLGSSRSKLSLRQPPEKIWETPPPPAFLPPRKATCIPYMSRFSVGRVHAPQKPSFCLHDFTSDFTFQTQLSGGPNFYPRLQNPRASPPPLPSKPLPCGMSGQIWEQGPCL